MGKKLNLSDDDWAQVTAYLDGEVDEKIARTLEVNATVTIDIPATRARAMNHAIEISCARGNLLRI